MSRPAVRARRGARLFAIGVAAALALVGLASWAACRSGGPAQEGDGRQWDYQMLRIERTTGATELLSDTGWVASPHWAVSDSIRVWVRRQAAARTRVEWDPNDRDAGLWPTQR